MDAKPALFLYPLEHSKILHLVICTRVLLFLCSLFMSQDRFPQFYVSIQVRHAQGIHNVAGEKDHNALLSPEYFDAHLSPLGGQQVCN